MRRNNLSSAYHVLTKNGEGSFAGKIVNQASRRRGRDESREQGIVPSGKYIHDVVIEGCGGQHRVDGVDHPIGSQDVDEAVINEDIRLVVDARGIEVDDDVFAIEHGDLQAVG